MDHIIETRGLTKRFGKLKAVDNMDLAVRKGEVFGLLGPNGAGKTTCIKMMVGLLKPTAGEVYINGQKVTPRSKVVRSLVGVVPQEVVIWPLMNTMENLLLMASMYSVPAPVAMKRGRELLESLQLWDKRKTLGRDLSGGMKRRLNLAMALMHDPEIVVLDEPSPGLDPQTRLLLWDFISEIPKRGEKTVILTTHFMEEADKLSTRVGIMDRGKLLVLDEPGKLKKNIGEGDTAEMGLDTIPGNTLLEEIRAINGVLEAAAKDVDLKIEARDVISLVPEIFKVMERNGARVTEFKVKSTTLEDVFIHLTGRSLREELYDQGGDGQ